MDNFIATKYRKIRLIYNREGYKNIVFVRNLFNHIYSDAKKGH